MKRILIIMSCLARNGTETFIYNLYNHIDRKKYEFHFLIDKNVKDGYENEILKLGGKIYYLNTKPRNVAANFAEINRFFKSRKNFYDAVHYCGNSFCWTPALYFARLYGIKKIIAHAHNSTVKSTRIKLMHYINKLPLSLIATDFLACSQSAADWGFKGTPAKKRSRVITNGINLDSYKFNPLVRSELRKSLNISHEDIVIGNVGRLSKVKNQKFLIDLVRRMRDEGIKVKLLLIGEGADRKMLEELAKSYELENEIYFLGLRKDINLLLNVIDIFVLPSLHEGLPFVCIEAQANSLPMLVSDTVSKEVAITDKVHFQSLDAPLGKWIEDIRNLTSGEREVISNTKSLMPYSITQTVKEMVEVYGK